MIGTIKHERLFQFKNYCRIVDINIFNYTVKLLKSVYSALCSFFMHLWCVIKIFLRFNDTLAKSINRWKLIVIFSFVFTLSWCVLRTDNDDNRMIKSARIFTYSLFFSEFIMFIAFLCLSCLLFAFSIHSVCNLWIGRIGRDRMQASYTQTCYKNDNNENQTAIKHQYVILTLSLSISVPLKNNQRMSVIIINIKWQILLDSYFYLLRYFCVYVYKNAVTSKFTFIYMI